MRPSQLLVAFASTALTVLSAAGHTAELPIACVAGACGANVPGFVSSGAAGLVQAGNTLTINQQTPNATLNWQSFNVSADGSVTFKQPDGSSIALNQIFQNDPSRIFGAVNANGRVFLINQNGILFGEGARINVGGLVASSLQMTQSALDNGIAQAIRDRQPAFTEFRAADGSALPSGAVEIARGAEISAPGGQVLVFAPEVTNRGTIRTPDGQTILAAGKSVYLLASSDPALRGLLVEVDAGGTVTNGEEGGAKPGARPEEIVGQIIAERGNVTLAGLAVNQQGRVSATTSVRFNGSIRLQARDTVDPNAGTASNPQLEATRGGVLTVGPDSRTEVTLDLTDTATAVDATAPARSQVVMSGREIRVLERSRVTATSGSIELSAQEDPRFPVSQIDRPDASRIHVAAGARLDVSGASTELAMERNVVETQLRANEVRDSPQQRDGALRGETVRVDVRRYGTRADGTTWVGTPLADVSGAIAGVSRGVAERNLTGGTVSFQSQGDVILAPGATVDVSGGAVTYRGGYIDSSQVISNGRVYDIGDASPDRRYDGVVNAYSVTNPVWGVTTVYPGFPSLGTFTPGYVEGKDAGSITVLAPHLVLDANFVGAVTIGSNQRLPTQSATDPARLYRPFDQLPRAGQLIIGRANPSGAASRRLTPDVLFSTTPAFPTLQSPSGGTFDPLTDPWPADVDELLLSPDILGAAGLGSLLIYSDGRIRVPQGVDLDPAAGGGQLQFVGRSIDFAGRVSSAGANVALVGGLPGFDDEYALRLQPTARIDVSGRWVNDNPTLGSASQRPPLLTAGGTVRLEASTGVLSIDAGSVVDVSGGAHRRVDGRINAGAAGSIAIAGVSSAALPPVDVRIAGELRGFGAARGGSLSVNAPAACIGGIDCEAQYPGALRIAPQFFSEGGFTSFAVTTSRGDLTVLPGTEIAPRAWSFDIQRDLSLVPSGTPLADIAPLTQQPDLLRAPVNLALRVDARAAEGGGPYSNATFASAPKLVIGSDALLNLDRGASLSLRSSTSMLVDGSVRAPAGRITLELDTGLALEDFPEAQGIWLGGTARLLAPGIATIVTDDAGRRSGDILDGGSVTVRALRGYFFASPGSLIDVSGVSATVDVRDGLDSGTYTARTLPSSGGLIDILAAEGAQLGGSLAAHAGTGDVDAMGGELRLAIDATNRAEVTVELGAGNRVSLFPGAARRVVLTQDSSPTIVAPFLPVPDTLNGLGQVAVSTIEQGGFADVTLAARNLADADGVSLRAPGTLTAFGDVDLRMPGRLVLDIARIDASGGAMRLAGGSYVGVGSSFRRLQGIGPAPLAGTGQLVVSGGFLELIGNSAYSGFADVTLESATDIRVRGVQPLSGRTVPGSLTTNGALTLRGEQIYPATLTDFTLAAIGSDARIEVLPGSGAAVSPLLSAGGTLRLQADTITHRGVLAAPFGTVELQGRRVELADRSRVVVSGAGFAVPFGETQGGFAWVYPLEDLQTLVYGVGVDEVAPPEKRVSLIADEVDIAAGSVIDASGGGELLASEFVPGVGGSRDVLSPLVSPTSFAVLPALSSDYSPFDPNLSRGSLVQAGDTVYLGAGSGLPAGTYAVLPARYAALPGAYLVTPTSGFTDLAPGQSVARLDGGIVVGGYRSIAGTGQRDGRSSGFIVRDRAQVAELATYDVTKGSVFFTNQADRADLPVPRLPADAGRLAIAASSSLSLRGTLLAGAEADGRGAELDIASRNILVTAGAPTGVSPGVVEISAADLSRLGAESILLGGTRIRRPDGIEISTADDSTVVIAADATLVAPEVMLAASRSVEVASGATVSATGTTAARNDEAPRETVSLVGDGAFLRVSTGAQRDLQRAGTAGTAGELRIAAGATIGATGSVLLDASAGFSLAGALQVRDADLTLSAQRIAFGGSPVPGTLTLSAPAIEALGMRSLELGSRSSIDFQDDVALVVDALTLRTAALNAGADDTRVALTARDARLVGSGVPSVIPAAIGTSVFDLAADSITLEGTSLQISQFADVGLDAASEVVFDGLRLFASGNVQLGAGRVVGRDGSTSSLQANGELLVEGSRQTSAVAAANAGAPGIGARLALSGASIRQSGRIDLPSGVLEMVATGSVPGGVEFGAGSVTNLAGRDFEFDGVAVGSSGGALRVDASVGPIRIAEGAEIDVSGAAIGGDAGTVDLRSPTGRVDVAGTLRGAAATGFESGVFRADGASLGALADLNRVLNGGGFLRERSFRVRTDSLLSISGTGDAAIRADVVNVIADSGRIDLSGEIATVGTRRAAVVLAARDAVAIRGRIDAATAEGGSVDLQSATQGVDIAPSASIALRDGELRLRMPRAAVLTVVDDIPGNEQLRLAGRISGARRIDLEGFAIYNDADGVISTGEVAASVANARYSDAAAFAARTVDIATALGRGDDERFHVLPGVEIRSTGDLRLAADWNLFGWRFGDEAGVLTLRAAGDLVMDRSLSDGFAAVTGTGAFLLPATPGDSWSYRLVAGADFASAAPLAIAAPASLPAGRGDFRISPGRVTTNVATPSDFRMVRTGTGRIEIAAGRDFVLGGGTSRASVVYTAGAASGGVPLNGLGARQYADGGGDVSIKVQRDFIGAPTNQLVTDWLWRTGRPADGLSPAATGWTTNFQRFEQGIGALGGGDITVAIGGNAQDLALSIPTTGRQVGGTAAVDSRVEVVAGGNLDVDVAGVLAGGSMYVGRGVASVRADSVVRSTTGQRPLYPLLALGDGQIRLTSRGDVGVEAIVNPTMVRQGSSQGQPSVRSFYSTYGEDSGVAIASSAGTVNLGGNVAGVAAALSSIPFQTGGTADERLALQLYPPRLQATAYAGDVRVSSGFTLFPSPRGNLELLAERDVLLAPVAQQALALIVSDTDPAVFPSVALPQGNFVTVSEVLGSGATQSANFHARVPVHAPTASAGRADPVRLVARSGDVRVLAPFDSPVTLVTPKATRVVAGGDIVDFSLLGQNLLASDVTSLIAGGSILYTTQRDAFGGIRASEREIELAGPGRLELVAGDSVDLQTARGITTTGNLFNPALAATGASVSVSAGIGRDGVDFSAFIDRYLAAGSNYDLELLTYAEELVRRPVATKAEALQILAAAPASQQAALVEAVFFAEIRASGRAAAKAGNTDFTRAFAAIETLFPGSNPDVEAGEMNAYAGDLQLYFSRIYTLDGGDVSMLVPGGLINAGLSTPPAAFGIGKSPAELGVVVQGTGSVNAFSFGDFLVNESRIFAADGGNVLVWSTRGDIDAGRGAKTAISAPPPTITIDDDGRPVVTFPAALTGSGIQTLATSAGRKPGDVDLFAPRGVVNASDAGIVAGNLTVAATAVLGTSNITVSGTSVGVPVDTGSLSIGVANSSAAGASATAAGETAVEGAGRADSEAPLADAALGWLEVYVEGFGDESCKPNDDECLERQRKQ